MIRFKEGNVTLIQDRFSAKAERRKAVTARSVKVKCGRDLDVDATIEGPTSYTELVGEIVTELSWSIVVTTREKKEKRK